MSTTSTEPMGVIPPPPGQSANFDNPLNQTKDTIALHIVCIFLATSFVVVRLYTRKFITKQLGLDDYFCTFAYFLTVAFSTLLIIGNDRGLGYHLWDIPASQLPAALEALTLADFIYLALVAFIKLSVLFFYKRIFVSSSKTMYFIHGGIKFVVVAYIAVFLATVFECRPIQKSWNAELPGNCYPPRILPWYSGALNVLTDVFVLVVPLPALAKLQLGLGRKLRIMAVFGLGIFACTTSIIRLAMTKSLYSDPDLTWNLSQIGIWAVIEVNVGIVCSCLLAFPAFIKRHVPETFGLYLTRLFAYRSSRQNESTGQRNVLKAKFSLRVQKDSPDEEHVVGDYVELGEGQKPAMERSVSNGNFVLDN